MASPTPQNVEQDLNQPIAYPPPPSKGLGRTLSGTFRKVIPNSSLSTQLKRRVSKGHRPPSHMSTSFHDLPRQLSESLPPEIAQNLPKQLSQQDMNDLGSLLSTSFTVSANASTMNSSAFHRSSLRQRSGSGIRQRRSLSGGSNPLATAQAILGSGDRQGQPALTAAKEQPPEEPIDPTLPQWKRDRIIRAREREKNSKAKKNKQAQAVQQLAEFLKGQFEHLGAEQGNILTATLQMHEQEKADMQHRIDELERKVQDQERSLEHVRAESVYTQKELRRSQSELTDLSTLLDETYSTVAQMTDRSDLSDTGGEDTRARLGSADSGGSHLATPTGKLQRIKDGLTLVRSQSDRLMAEAHTLEARMDKLRTQRLRLLWENFHERSNFHRTLHFFNTWRTETAGESVKALIAHTEEAHSQKHHSLVEKVMSLSSELRRVVKRSKLTVGTLGEWKEEEGGIEEEEESREGEGDVWSEKEVDGAIESVASVVREYGKLKEELDGLSQEREMLREERIRLEAKMKLLEAKSTASEAKSQRKIKEMSLKLDRASVNLYSERLNNDHLPPSSKLSINNVDFSLLPRSNEQPHEPSFHADDPNDLPVTGRRTARRRASFFASSASGAMAVAASEATRNSEGSKPRLHRAKTFGGEDEMTYPQQPATRRVAGRSPASRPGQSTLVSVKTEGGGPPNNRRRGSIHTLRKSTSSIDSGLPEEGLGPMISARDGAPPGLPRGRKLSRSFTADFLSLEEQMASQGS